MNRIRGAVVVRVCAAVGAAGIGGVLIASASGGGRQPMPTPASVELPIAYTQNRGHLVPIPTSASPQEIVDLVTARLGGTKIVSAGLGVPPAVPGQRPGTWLDFVVAVPAVDERAIRAEWEADLVEGAVADAFAQRGFPRVVGSSIDGRLPNGAIVDHIAGGMGNVANGQKFANDSDAVITEVLSRKLTEANLKPLSLTVLRADQPAPAVIAITSTPAAAAKAAAATIQSLFGADPPNYEGYYFQVVDQEGAAIFVASASFRVGVGRLWINQGFEGVASLNHG